MRIHGTMYRKTWTAEGANAVQYIVVDQQLRTQTADRLQLNPQIVRALERHVLHGNPYMTAIQKLAAPTSTRCPDRVLQLDWDEGIQEVAAILDSAGGARTSPRSVFFRLHKSEQYDYIPPLSELYEPLSYPLWYPRGGRGWAPDLNTPEHKMRRDAHNRPKAALVERRGDAGASGK